VAQTITIANATYSDVPAIDVPKAGGGTARFWDAEDGNLLEYGNAVPALVGTAMVGLSQLGE